MISRRVQRASRQSEVRPPAPAVAPALSPDFISDLSAHGQAGGGIMKVSWGETGAMASQAVTTLVFTGLGLGRCGH